MHFHVNQYVENLKPSNQALYNYIRNIFSKQLDAQSLDCVVYSIASLAAVASHEWC